MGTAGTGTGLARLLGVVVIVIGMLNLAGCGDIYSRTDFTTMVMGKSDKEVTKALGKPAGVEETDASHVTWTYKSGTFDLDNQNKRDSKAMVIFERKAPGGAMVVTEVKFES
jgi:hypothetical protein